MIKILHYLALFRVKNANSFAKFFGENILKNHNIGPRTVDSDTPWDETGEIITKNTAM
jgi:hypothetical protein